MSAVAMLRRPGLVRGVRVLLGLLLVVAGLAKIGAPQAFAGQIENFDALPIGWENLFAVTLPWVEVVAGLALGLGVQARSAAWLALGLLLVFDAAIVQAMARGLNIDCGCFGTAAGTRVGLAKLAENGALTLAAAIASLRVR